MARILFEELEIFIGEFADGIRQSCVVHPKFRSGKVLHATLGLEKWLCRQS